MAAPSLHHVNDNYIQASKRDGRQPLHREMEPPHCWTFLNIFCVPCELEGIQETEYGDGAERIKDGRPHLHFYLLECSADVISKLKTCTQGGRCYSQKSSRHAHGTAEGPTMTFIPMMICTTVRTCLVARKVGQVKTFFRAMARKIQFLFTVRSYWVHCVAHDKLNEFIPPSYQYLRCVLPVNCSQRYKSSLES